MWSDSVKIYLTVEQFFFVVAVTGLSLIFSICGTAIVCTFYTTIGGLKAVIWTDVIQCFVMWGGFAAIIIEGCIHVGGIEEVLRIAYEGGRIEFLRFPAAIFFCIILRILYAVVFHLDSISTHVSVTHFSQSLSAVVSCGYQCMLPTNLWFNDI